MAGLSLVGLESASDRFTSTIKIIAARTRIYCAMALNGIEIETKMLKNQLSQ